MSTTKSKIPSWFNGTIYKKGNIVKNRFSGEECELNNVEPEGAKRLLSVPLREKLEAEAESLKLINRQKASRGSLTTFMSKE